VSVWIDPRIYKRPFQEIIDRDFGSSDEVEFHYLHEEEGAFHDMFAVHGSDLLSYALKDDNYFARLYIMPGRRMLRYHKDIMNTILKTLGIALLNLMNIKRLQNAAAIDPLTNCYNKREFIRQMERHIANASRYGNDLSVILFDIDHFKNVNDIYGHQAGDKVLERVSGTLFSEIRKGDCLSRYGGDEFVIILPYTKKARAMELADRVRRVVENLEIRIAKKKSINVTASFGVASLKNHSDQESLLSDADSMLYKAKASGRNTVMPQIKLFVSGRI
jgi:diguanylate cyclase (GGDEF)-like protein